MYRSGFPGGLIAAFTVILAPQAIAKPSSSVWMFGTAESVVIHVSARCGNDDWTGLSPNCAAPDGPKLTIRAGMVAARTGDTVLVADGVYFGRLNRDLFFPFGENFTVRSRNGPEACIIDGSDLRPAFFFADDETPDAVIEGFTVRNCRYVRGGAVFITHEGAPTFINCVFTNNIAADGGAIYSDVDSSPTFIGCLFERNAAGYFGGAIKSESTRRGPRLINCTIRNNLAELDGGGIWFAFVGGERIADLLTNCTIADNTANGRGGGLVVGDGNGIGTVAVSNSVFWGNSGTQIIGNGPAVTYSNVQDGFPGEGNIDADPLFVDRNRGDYHLSPGSPAIDAGDPNFLSQPGDTDIDGQKRVWNGRIDMGSDEFGSFAFGDLNCDGAIDAFDIEPFLVALFEPDEYPARFPSCDIELADVNADGRVDAFDIEPFLDLLFGP